MSPTVVFRSCYYLLRGYKAYYKAYLIKVIDILRLYPILINHALYGRKLGS